ncbi:S8 family peptidase, partial [bacterium]|nr:S8 family peptidase [bacterium]
LICGKTEDVRSETPVEEDYYVAGLEWAEDLGADVVSSSLGYIAWYTFEDMDGNTAVTTIAVDIAVSRGIVVCTAAGNERDDPWGHIISPADADSVIAVGAVDSYGIISDFSSPGPTYDGRTKPEVCAQGVETYAAVPWFGTDGYWRVSGTSLSTPIVAGICVLLLEAHPDWTPIQLREALLMTANQASSPDNDYGWGIPDGVAALDYISASPLFEDFTPQKRILISAYPNPVNSVATWTIEIPQSEIGSFTITDILGRTVAHISQKQWTAGHYSVPFQTTYLSSGIYFGRFDGIRSQAVGKVVLIK